METGGSARNALTGASTQLTRWLVSPERRVALVALLLVLALSVFYAFMASSGTFRDLGRQSHYATMAEGFERGHLYVPRKPSRQLLQQEDPFHPSNKPAWIWDASLYDGHWYFYWGPVPALGVWAWKGLTGDGRISDQTLTLIFMIGRLCAGALLLLGLARTVRAREPTWLVGSAIAVFGLSSPIPFIVARPMVYEACLAAGQCFLFWGLLFAFWGLLSPRWRTAKLALAGVCWGLAIGSRVTMVIPVPLLIVITVSLIWWRSDRRLPRLLSNTTALGVPVALAVGGYALYNYGRFESFTEFGTSWQASLQRFTTNRVFVIPNLYSYLFAPIDWSCDFPFVRGMRRRALSPLIEWPRDYAVFELVGGLLLLSAWCWLGLVVLYRPLAAGWVMLRRRGSGIAHRISTEDLWATLCSLAILLSMLPVLGLWEASMRYPGDAIGGVVLATSVAAFWLRRRADASGNRAIRLSTRGVLGALALHTCVIGALSGVASYGDPFPTNNRALYDKLRATLSFCPQPATARGGAS